MKLRDIMTRFPQTVADDDTLLRARDLMVWGGFRHLPVVEASSRRLLGVITDTDLALFQVQRGHRLTGSPDALVAEAMTREPETASPDDSVVNAAERLASQKIGCLPIIEAGMLVGLVTVTDILAAQVRAAMEVPARTSPVVGDAMRRDPETVHPDDRLLDATARMQRCGVRHLPVVDGDGRVVGILSDTDVRAAFGNPSQVFSEESRTPHQLLKVEDAMSSPPITTTADQSCAVAARAFADLRASAVPVVDSDDKLQGILSYVDVLRAFGE